MRKINRADYSTLFEQFCIFTVVFENLGIKNKNFLIDFIEFWFRPGRLIKIIFIKKAFVAVIKFKKVLVFFISCIRKFFVALMPQFKRRKHGRNPVRKRKCRTCKLRCNYFLKDYLPCILLNYIACKKFSKDCRNGSLTFN